ncbi:MAG: toprim domain-containing protein, partial [Bacteroidota bacterium]
TSSSPKDITTFQNGAKEVFVFEGFMDFLSFMVIAQKTSVADTDFVILNSVSFFEKARAFMEQHDIVNLYLDNDLAGQKCSQYALSISEKYTDKSSLYKKYKDLNEWLMNSGNKQKKSLKQKP